MPTPVSESFAKRAPRVPPTFDGVDFDKTDELKARQDAVLREQWIKSMMVRLLRDQLSKCYRSEGNNHLEKCAEERDRYINSLKDAKIKGYIFLQQNYEPK